MGIRDGIAKGWDAFLQSGAKDVGQRATQFVLPGEQLQVAFNATLGVRGSAILIAVTDKAIVLIRPSGRIYKRYPRNKYLQLAKSKSPMRIGRKWFRLGVDVLCVFPNDPGYWEYQPPTDHFQYGTVDEAVDKANSLLGDLTPEQRPDAAPELSRAPLDETALADPQPPSILEPTPAPNSAPGTADPPPEGGEYVTDEFRVPINPLAKWSLILSIAGWLFFGFGSWVTSPLVIVLGILALRDIKRTNQKGHALAIAAVVIGAVGAAFWAFVFLVGRSPPP